MMKRYKSIDIFRGISMVWMILSHLMGWWIRNEDIWLASLLKRIFDGIFGPAAFLFISGVSTALSYRNNSQKTQISEEYNKKLVRNEYLFRSLFILIIALGFNIFIAIGSKNIANIWIWYILFTVAISLFLSWPLLKTRKIYRLILGALLWVFNLFFLEFLTPYKGEFNLYGIIFHLLYNSLYLAPITAFFTFFLIGTVIGDIIYESSTLKSQDERDSLLILKLIFPSYVCGISLIISGIFYNYPDLFNHISLSWLIYSLGFHLVIFSTMLIIEEFEIIKTNRNYKFFYYFSYYSLTIYLTHYLLYFLFLDQFNTSNIMLFVIGTIIIMGFFLRFIYNRWGDFFSIKSQISKLSKRYAKKIQMNKNN